MRASRGTCLVALVLGLGCGAPQAPPAGPPGDTPDARPPDRPRDGGSPGADAAGADSAVTADATASADAAEPADAADAAGGEDGAGTDASSDGGSAGPWARNVRIGLVEAAQSVFVRLGDGATTVAPGARNAEVIEGRPLLVRVHVQPAAGFTPRRLRGVLTVSPGDAAAGLALEDAKMIGAASDPEKLETTFNFLVPADAVKPQARLRAELYETAAAGGPDPGTPPRFPATGTLDLAVRAGRMVLDVVMVPSVGPSGALDDAPARRKRVENHLYDVYPVQRVNVTWREPLRFTTKVSSTMGFQTLVQTRTRDQAPAGTYYHLLLAKEDSSEGLLGIANLANATAADGPRRIAMTFVEGHAVDTLLDTISHEMGHNHGRNHAPGCNARGVDMGFPYAGPGIGVNGYSLSDQRLLIVRLHKDLMGYCNVTWVSDYTWRGFMARVRAVSAFPAADRASAPLATRALVGFQTPGQAPAWALTRGQLGPHPGEVAPPAHTPEGTSDLPARLGAARARAHIRLGDGRTVTAPVGVRTLSDDRTRELALDLPDEGQGEIAAVDVMVDGARLSVPSLVFVDP
jgi:hypothetical protein